jgi:hypothetical protein
MTGSQVTETGRAKAAGRSTAGWLAVSLSLRPRAAC